jgi:hypothetical protein
MATLEPSCVGGGPEATWHVATPEPSPAGWRARSMWKHRSPFLMGCAHGASGHMATPEPFPGGWRTLCHGARGDTGALFCRVVCSVPQGTWRSQSPLAPGTDLESWDWSFNSCHTGNRSVGYRHLWNLNNISLGIDLDFKQCDVVYGWTTYVNVVYEDFECVWMWM